MDFNHTQQQSSDEQLRAQALSLKPSRPPTQVPGYEPRKFLGAGAYGEVWVAVDRNTGRQVAIKFYAHQGGLDWSILSREVEKLAFLSADRYVVQLLDVGWEADPPYYVMEYVEQGSLEERLKREGQLGAREAVVLFRDVAVGLLHAHGKGVLHCDLKPANVLLDQDSRPRLADLGQSRLSHEQTPPLGTLLYMAPEQADLQAVPDVRWDVYALGALLYSMLTGTPPYRSEAAITEFETATDLEERLSRYRQLIKQSPLPTKHRQVPGVDRELADIVDGCLAPDRERRYANVQEVLDALNARERRRARRPLVLTGFVGPALLLGIVLVFAWNLFETVLGESDEALQRRALESNRFAAQYVAKTVTNKLELFYRAVEEMAGSSRFQTLLEKTLDDPALADLRRQLNDPRLNDSTREQLRKELVAHPARLALQQRLQDLLQDDSEPEDVASWFITDPEGLQLARAPEHATVGDNFSWRTYFHGGDEDYPQDWRAKPNEHITKTNLSAVFYSQLNNRWTVTISTPVETEGDDGREGRFLGVVGLAVDVHQFVEIKEGHPFAVLIDWRPGPNKGLVLQHPLFDKLLNDHQKIPERFQSYKLKKGELPETQAKEENYIDPLAKDPQGKDYNKHWLAKSAPVSIREGNTGWMVIVQESYQGAIGGTLARLKRSLFSSGLLAAALIAVMSTVLWALVIRALGEPTRIVAKRTPVAEEP
ncbi:MAG: serine/threonine protein kinase [Planctomycetia bacterium]|nr:serine/threonine protein kinase [Planctomycetia bacterium]